MQWPALVQRKQKKQKQKLISVRLRIVWLFAHHDEVEDEHRRLDLMVVSVLPLVLSHIFPLPLLTLAGIVRAHLCNSKDPIFPQSNEGVEWV